MILNEEDAKEKQCPIWAIAFAQGVHETGGIPKCSGSKCMMWQWGTSPEEAEHLNKDCTKDEIGIEAMGYCGLVTR